MEKVYMLQAILVYRGYNGDFMDAEEVTVGMYSSLELAEEAGEKLINDKTKNFEGYSVVTWDINDEATVNFEGSNTRQFGNRAAARSQ